MSANSAWSGARPHIDESELRCKTGCGFYGNPTWDGHCSKCYKELMHKRQQRKTVFDPTQIKNKVSRSVSDVSEFQSKATSLMSRKFDKFEEKRRQQLDKKTKAVKSIFKKSQTNKEIPCQELKEHHKSIRHCKESQAAVTEFQEFFKSVSKGAQQSLSKHIKAFMDKSSRTVEQLSVDELADHVHDFYNSLNDLMATQAVFQELTQEQVDKVGELTEMYITTRLFKVLMSEVNAYSEEKDLAIQKRIRSLSWVSTSHLECKVDETKPEVRVIMDQIITDLIEMDSKRVPSSKLELLVNASHQVLNLLKMSSGGVPASADDFLPALIYCVIRANPPLLQSNICYVTNFAQQSCLQSGEAGYFFTNLCCAVSFIEKLTADSLGLTGHEFARYMSGDALPPDALDRDYRSDGMQLMQQNLDNLTQLETHLNKLITSYDTIIHDMDEFKDNLSREVEDVLDRTPLVIRPTKANIDEPDPAQELLPPPLMPQSSTCLYEKPSEMSVLGGGGGASSPTPLLPFDGMKTPEQTLESGSATPLSSDIAAAQKSLHFLQALEAAPSPSLSLSPAVAEEAESHVDYSAFDLDNLNASVDPFFSAQPSCFHLPGSHSSTSFDPFSSLDSSASGQRSFLASGAGVIPEEAPPAPAETSQETFSDFKATFPPPPQLNFTYPGAAGKSGLLWNPTPYTGFSVQGGRIPNIPCDTGFSHYMASSAECPPDPLSPPMQSATKKPLPPPLVPTTSSSGGAASDPNKGDKLDKMVNLLGDIVDTFDNLL